MDLTVPLIPFIRIETLTPPPIYCSLLLFTALPPKLVIPSPLCPLFGQLSGTTCQLRATLAMHGPNVSSAKIFVEFRWLTGWSTGCGISSTLTSPYDYQRLRGFWSRAYTFTSSQRKLTYRICWTVGQVRHSTSYESGDGNGWLRSVLHTSKHDCDENEWKERLDRLRIQVIAVVTGGTDGIGKAYTFELARARGIRKFFLIGRNINKLEAIKKELGEI